MASFETGDLLLGPPMSTFKCICWLMAVVMISFCV
jgi:hypothetical protein